MSAQRTGPQRFRAGDTVKHAPSDETWVLACDEELGKVMAAGWPESLAEAKDCTLIEAATDAQRLDMLRQAQGGDGYRGSLARRQLRAAPVSPAPAVPRFREGRLAEVCCVESETHMCLLPANHVGPHGFESIAPAVPREGPTPMSRDPQTPHSEQSEILAWLNEEQKRPERYVRPDSGVVRFTLTLPELGRIRNALLQHAPQTHADRYESELLDSLIRSAEAHGTAQDVDTLKRIHAKLTQPADLQPKRRETLDEATLQERVIARLRKDFAALLEAAPDAKVFAISREKLALLVSSAGSASQTPAPAKPTCQHGTALDVHCCNCHSGFLFDAESCVCTFDPPPDWFKTVREAAALGLSYGAGNSIAEKEKALRDIYALCDRPAAPASPKEPVP